MPWHCENEGHRSAQGRQGRRLQVCDCCSGQCFLSLYGSKPLKTSNYPTPAPAMGPGPLLAQGFLKNVALADKSCRLLMGFFAQFFGSCCYCYPPHQVALCPKPLKITYRTTDLFTRAEGQSSYYPELCLPSPANDLHQMWTHQPSLLPASHPACETGQQLLLSPDGVVLHNHTR